MEGPSDKRDTQTQWSYWIALRLVHGVGNVTYRQLLENFTSLQVALNASTAALIETGVSLRVAQNITAFDHWADVEAEVHRLKQVGARLVIRKDDEYPERLGQIHDPPPFLYVQGRFVPEDRVSITIVGARMASTYGRGVERELAQQLGAPRITVVSGMAVVLMPSPTRRLSGPAVGPLLF